ncbi:MULTISPECIES: nitrate/nitrite transporter [unclassified Actinotalea]|uniref:MFS transporter n=1 Tax=unclassified Actinotalea TaxID=2638618 RepID=UPI0021034824|nr:MULTISPECIES: MFS transporter [unclassified Actinotalea]
MAAFVAYAIGVLHRGSLGVASVEATERFGVGAAVLSTFVVVQLGVYAALQVPAGVLLDRFGPRVMIGSGAVLMATGQLLLGVVEDLPAAYVARVLIGAGDAATFISVVRLVAAWFPARRVPLLTQLTGIVGQSGQVAAAVPLVAVLHLAGWQTAFVGLAAVGAMASALAFGVVRDGPPGTVVRSGGGLLSPVREVARVPGTWLGFWSHALSQFSFTVFVLLWGYPFLTVAQGLSPAQAGGLLTLNALAVVASGPVVGTLTGRHPLRRSWMVLTIAFATLAAWVAVLVHPGRSPLWLLVVLVVVLGVGGPGSAIGFDYARTFNASGRLGTATGLVNVGGFAVAVVSVLAVGVVLDVAATRGAAPLSLEAFRPAFAVMLLPWLGCLAGLLLSRRATRREMASRGVVVPPVRAVLARRRGARAADGTP